jgi:hypothetical protein
MRPNIEEQSLGEAKGLFTALDVVRLELKMLGQDTTEASLDDIFHEGERLYETDMDYEAKHVLVNVFVELRNKIRSLALPAVEEWPHEFSERWKREFGYC